MTALLFDSRLGAALEAVAAISRRSMESVSVPVRRVDGQLDWPQLAGLLAKARI
jgi:hypothetical protein